MKLPLHRWWVVTYRARRWAWIAFALSLSLIFTASSARGGRTAQCLGHRVTIRGGSASEFLLGTDRNDVILGGAGDDTIIGSLGRDRLCGGRGDDTLDGGPDQDRASGGPGTDRCMAERRKRCES